MGLAFQSVPKNWVVFPSHTCMYDDDDDEDDSDGDGHDDNDLDDGYDSE